MSRRITHFETHGKVHDAFCSKAWSSFVMLILLDRCSFSDVTDRRWHRCNVSSSRNAIACSQDCVDRNTECDYSSAYISIFTDGESPLVGHGMTFTIGRGNELVRRTG